MEAQEIDSSDAARGELAALLRTHSQELEDIVIARLREADPALDFDPDDFVWLRSAAAESVDGMVALFEEGDQWTLPLEIATRIKCRARRGASLEDILRAFTIVGSVLFEFLTEKTNDLPLSREALSYVASWPTRHGDRLVKAFASAYEEEIERMNRSPSRHLVQSVEDLLRGGTGNFADLDYRLEANHVGVIAVNARAELECRTMAEHLGCDLLVVPDADDTVWAWFGSSRQINIPGLKQLVSERGPLSMAAGEQRYGLDGWRLTHREAQAALAVALLEPPGLTRYSEVALVADAIKSEAATKTLIYRYLEPWRQFRDGERLRETVRAYLDSDCNAASTASALGVNRHTVQRRLKKVEEAIGEPLSARRAELDVALRLERLTVRTADGKRVSPGEG